MAKNPVSTIATIRNIENSYVKKVLSQNILSVNQVSDLLGVSAKVTNKLIERNKLNILYPYKSLEGNGPKFVNRDQSLLDVLNKKYGLSMKLKKADNQSQIDYNKEFIKRFNVARQSYGKLFGKTLRELALPSKAETHLKKLKKIGVTVNDLIRATINAYNSEHHQKTKGRFITPEFITREDKFQMYIDNTAE